jgi:hypothetical protein
VGAKTPTYIYYIKLNIMKVLSVWNNELVEVMWIDDNEIEYIPIDEFRLRYPDVKI